MPRPIDVHCPLCGADEGQHCRPAYPGDRATRAHGLRLREAAHPTPLPPFLVKAMAEARARGDAP